MDVIAAVLESWNRQGRIMKVVAERVNESNRHAKPSADGWSLDHQLAHVHKVRQFHLAELAPERASQLGDPFVNDWEDPIEDFEAIRQMLDESAKAVHEVLSDALASGKGLVGAYDHPIFLLQHLVMHEGWHLGLIFLALRLNGEEIPEEWEETHVWSEWRND